MELDQYKYLDLKKQTAQLKNGARLVHFKKPGAPISISIYTRSGARFDPTQKEGSAHLMEHMLLAGSSKYPTKDKLVSIIEEIGGHVGAFTSKEAVGIEIDVADAKDMPLVEAFIKESVLNPAFKDKVFEKEKGSVLKEHLSSKENPKSYIGRLFRQNIFQGSKLAKSILGSSESQIKSLEKSDILDYYKSQFLPSQKIIVSCGDIEISTLQKYFEQSLPKSSQSTTTSPDINLLNRENPLMVENYKSKNSVQVAVGFRTCPFSGQDKIPLTCLASILAGGRVSILMRKLRYEHGLIYSIAPRNEYLSEAGFFSLYYSTDKASLNRSLKIIKEEIKKIRDGDLDQKDLTFVKNRIIKSKKLQLQTSGSYVGFYAYNELIDPENSPSIVEYLKTIDSVTKKDVVDVCSKYFGEDNWFLSICGDITEPFVKL